MRSRPQAKGRAADLEKMIDLKNELAKLRDANATLERQLADRAQEGAPDADEATPLVVSLSMQVADLSAQLDEARRQIEALGAVALPTREELPPRPVSAGRWGYAGADDE